MYTLRMSMSLEKQTEIEQIIEKLKINTGLSYPENSLLELAEALRLRVGEMTLPPFNGKQVRAFVKWFSDGEKNGENKNYEGHIGLHEKLSPEIKNFTLAHQIGHFLLRHSYEEGENTGGVWVDLEDYSAEKDKDDLEKEIEADYFAACLLIPKDELAMRLQNASSLDELAKSFAISKTALESRIKWLGYK